MRILKVGRKQNGYTTLAISGTPRGVWTLSGREAAFGER